MRLAVFHFNCIEYYPPLMNFIRCLPEHLQEKDRVAICSTRPDNKALFESPDERISIHRPAPFTLRLSAAKRVLGYLRYNLGALFFALRFRPDVILYYETISAWVPWVLKRFLFRDVPLFIHYHEYMSPAEYANGMFLNRYFHGLEKQLYPKAAQISHTNDYRMKLFRKDEGLEESDKLQVIPNYPPGSWAQVEPQPPGREGVGIIYVGSLNFKDFYLEAFIKWVEAQDGQVYFDIYCLNDDFQLAAYLKAHDIKLTRFMGNAPYDRLPEILRSYQVGVILYNSTAENTVYSAPNKLFEYVACGLDVWFPEGLKGALEFITTDTFPKIIPVDFKYIQNWKLAELLNHTGLTYKPSAYSSDIVNSRFIKRILAFFQNGYK